MSKSKENYDFLEIGEEAFQVFRDMTALQGSVSAPPGEWVYHEGSWNEEKGVGYAEFRDGDSFYRIQVLEEKGPALDDLRSVSDKEVREMLEDRGVELVHTLYLPEASGFEATEYGFEEVDDMPEGYFQRVEELSDSYNELLV